jgi:DNA-binding MarR family transcriptional regulator
MSGSASQPLSGYTADWRTLMPICLKKAGRPRARGLRSGELLMRFAASARALHEGFRRVFQPKGWSDHKFIVLVVLSAHDPQPFAPSELARQAGVTRASMTDVLHELELRKWIERTPDTADRRMARIKLTPRGHEEIANAIVLFLEMAHAIVRPLSPRDLRAFARICARLACAGTGFEATKPSRTPSL